MSISETSKIETEIESEVIKQFSYLFSDRAILAKLKDSFPSTKVKRALSVIKQTQPIIFEIRDTQTNKKKGTFLDAVLYLFIIESSTSLVADISIMALVAKGHLTLKNPEMHRLILKVKSIEDLKNPKITLGNKLTFLEDSGLTCFKKYASNALRNSIAHMDFEITNNGDFLVYRNETAKKEQVNIQQEWRQLAFLNSKIIHLVKSKVDTNKEIQRKWKNS